MKNINNIFQVRLKMIGYECVRDIAMYYDIF